MSDRIVQTKILAAGCLDMRYSGTIIRVSKLKIRLAAELGC